MGDITGRIAIVTGAGSGIGRACCRILAAHGATIVAAGRTLSKVQATADMIIADGGKACAKKVEVKDEASIEALMAEVYNEFGKIDILVNSAGILDPTRVPDMTVDRWDIMLETNLRGTFLCCQKALVYMEKAKSGAIVNITSQAGQLGGWQAGINYSASKGGILAVTKALARHCAPFNVRVNDVAPGQIATEMTATRENLPKEIPMLRLGTPEEVANAVWFLASDLSSFCTGTTIDVNGGQLMRS